MDEQALISRMMALPITAGRARRLFPGVNVTAIYQAAPFDGRGRFLTFGRAFEVAKDCANRDAQDAEAALAAAGRAADQEQNRAAHVGPALAYLAGAVERETSALVESLRARSVAPRAVAMIEGIAAVNARQIARVWARVGRGARNV